MAAGCGEAGRRAIGVTIGDFATTRVDGTFSLVYLVYNTIRNLTTQAEQVACFRNAAAHLEPGGCFVIEVDVPDLRRLPPGETLHALRRSRDHWGSTSTTSRPRAWSRTTTTRGRRVEVSSARSATPGPPNSTSWPASPGYAARAVGRLAARAVHRARASSTSRSGRSRRSRGEVCAVGRGRRADRRDHLGTRGDLLGGDPLVGADRRPPRRAGESSIRSAPRACRPGSARGG